jgi:hypothetical protein
VTAGKSFALTERVKLSFYAQAFNVLNHAQWLGGRIDEVAPVGYTVAQPPYLSRHRQYLTSPQFLKQPEDAAIGLETGLLTSSPRTSGKEGFAGVSGFGAPFSFSEFLKFPSRFRN